MLRKLEAWMRHEDRERHCSVVRKRRRFLLTEPEAGAENLDLWLSEMATYAASGSSQF
jgi:hypothetical protein